MIIYSIHKASTTLQFVMFHTFLFQSFRLKHFLADDFSLSVCWVCFSFIKKFYNLHLTRCTIATNEITDVVMIIFNVMSETKRQYYTMCKPLQRKTKGKIFQQYKQQSYNNLILTVYTDVCNLT